MRISDNLRYALIECEKGNENAFTTLYEESKQYVAACIYKVFSGDVNVQYIMYDIINDTYLEIWQRIGQITDNEKFLSWAGTIATRKCYDYLRKNRKYVLLSEEDTTFDKLSDSDDIIPESVMQDREKQRLVREIIDKQLSEMEKLCIISYYYNEVSQPEIAKQFEIPENTVKTHLRRAKGKIKLAVLDLEKNKNTKLYSIAPFMLLLLGEDMQSIYLPPNMLNLQYAYAKLTNGITGGVVNPTAGAVTGGVANPTAGVSGATIGGSVKGVASKGIFGRIAALSIKAKIAGGIGVIAIAGVITGGVYLLTHQDKNVESPEQETASNQTTDKNTEEVTVATTERTTEKQTETVTEEPVVEDVQYKEAYLDILESNKDLISNYKWQYGYNWDSGEPVPEKEPTPIAVCDITGDDIPELIFISSENGEYGPGNLNIYTYEDESAKQIYNVDWDVYAASGTCYYLFKINGSSDLYAYKSLGDESMNYSYIQFGFDESGKMLEEHKWNMKEGPNEDYTGRITIYTLDNSEITEQEYNDVAAELKAGMSEVLIYNEYVKDVEAEIKESGNSVDKLNMTYEEAIKFLGGDTENDDAGINNGAEAAAITLPKDLPDSFILSSGAGAWSTELHIDLAGNFDGSYHDSDMGDIGNGYQNGSIYICEFNGKFTNIKKLNEYSYSMELEYIDTEEESGKEWIENEIRYIASDPYGLEEGKDFVLYIPGTPLSELSDELVDWLSMPLVWESDSRPETLPFYVLYNVTTERGFYSSGN